MIFKRSASHLLILIALEALKRLENWAMIRLSFMRIEPPMELEKPSSPIRLFFIIIAFSSLALFLGLLSFQTWQPVPPAAAPLKAGTWDLNSPTVFKTKSSSAEWLKPEFHYEVPSPLSIAGINFHTPGKVDASKFRALKITASTAADLENPDSVRIEMKAGDQTLRVFGIKLKGMPEENFQFPLHFKLPTTITEISFVVTHAKAGAAKKGGFGITELAFA